MPSATKIAPQMARCRYCGSEHLPELDRCPSCGAALSQRSAKIVLVVTLVLLVAGVAITQWLVNLHRVTEVGLAHRWFTRGEQAMQANMPQAAAECFRAALNYDRENRQYRLRLAQALLAQNRVAEARAHLLSLWEQTPADGEVNLTLARLEAHSGNVNEAIRYYNNAINGVWETAPREQRTAARFELARYLMQNQRLPQAEADLMELQADAPAEPANQLLLAEMLLQLGEPSHALQSYQLLLSKEPTDAQAWLGESKAYVALGRYSEAERAAARAVQYDAKLQGARDQLELTRDLLGLAPGLRGLTLAERARRVAKAFDAAMTRLRTCAANQSIDLVTPPGANPAPAAKVTNGLAASAPNALQLLYTSGLQKQSDATETALRKNPDALEPTMQYVFQVEKAAASICPDMTMTDRALLTLAQHEGEAVR